MTGISTLGHPNQRTAARTTLFSLFGLVHVGCKEASRALCGKPQSLSPQQSRGNVTPTYIHLEGANEVQSRRKEANRTTSEAQRR